MQVLKRTIDSANESARQHQADQEVINFLDGRVHELEEVLAELRVKGDARDKGMAEAEKLEIGRARSLEELLQWEREKFNKQVGVCVCVFLPITFLIDQIFSLFVCTPFIQLPHLILLS
jgi:hypothetical protein